jgi:hypothetical protein
VVFANSILTSKVNRVKEYCRLNYICFHVWHWLFDDYSILIMILDLCTVWMSTVFRTFRRYELSLYSGQKKIESMFVSTQFILFSTSILLSCVLADACIPSERGIKGQERNVSQPSSFTRCRIRSASLSHAFCPSGALL